MALLILSLITGPERIWDMFFSWDYEHIWSPGVYTRTVFKDWRASRGYGLSSFYVWGKKKDIEGRRDVGVACWKLESGPCTKKSKTSCLVGCGQTNERGECRECPLLGCCIVLAIQVAEGCK
jgi:hypothetical protein